jgi:hypothetical protein
MRITESQLRKIVRQEIRNRHLSEAPDAGRDAAWTRGMHRNDAAIKFAYDARDALGTFTSALDFTGEVIDVGPEAACHAYPEAKRLCAETPADLLEDPEWLELVIGVLNDTDLD